MTNERLVDFIKQGGNDELIPILWDNVKKLLYILADRYYSIYSDDLSRYGVTVWDLKQQAYSAFLKAIEGYDESKGYKFTTYLKYPFKNAIRSLRTRDTLNRSESLNTMITEKDNIEAYELGDTIPDKHSLDFTENLENDSLYQTVRQAIDKLPEREKWIITERYYKNRTLADIAAEKERSSERIRQHEKRALQRLRNNRDIRRLADELGYSSQRIYHNNYSSFKHSSVSNVEIIACERADIEARLF